MIVDASVAFKWIFVEDGSDAAARLIGRGDLFAPSLLLAEVGNALWKKGMRGELGDSAAYSVQLGLVASIVTSVEDTEIMPRALDIALELEHAIYDCIYLALAEARGDVLVSADEKFVRKAHGHNFVHMVEMLG